MAPDSGVLAVVRNQVGMLLRIVQVYSMSGAFNGARELALMEQRAGHEHVGIDLHNGTVFCLRQREPFIEDLFCHSEFTTKLVHRGEMKQKGIHLFHSHQSKSEFPSTLEIESRFGRGESTYCKDCRRHHAAKSEFFRVTFRRFWLLLHETKTGLQKA